jgi:hypothetical protein
MIVVVILAVYFLIRGAWWVSAILVLAEIMLEGGFHAARRYKQRAATHAG